MIVIDLRIVHRPDTVVRDDVPPRVFAWADVVRGQRCADCGQDVGDEVNPGDQVQLLMLGADLVGQQVREAAGLVHLARCLLIHRRCADALDGQEIAELAARALDVLAGV